jgi:hypothetical protein
MPFRCYGDDLITDKRITSNVVEALEYLGFEVNTEKSFLGKATFRESCGGSYYRGADVTPLRFKTKALASRISVDVLAGVIDLANRAFDYGYVHLRATIIRYAMRVPIQGLSYGPRRLNPILFVNWDDEETSMALRCLAPRNTHLKRRFNQSLFRSEYRRVGIGPKNVVNLSRSHDWYHYTLWWRSHYEEDGFEGDRDCHPFLPLSFTESTSVLTDDALAVGAKWGWTPI